MAKHSLSKNLHKLNFSRQQIDILHTMMLTGYKMHGNRTQKNITRTNKL